MTPIPLYTTPAGSVLESLERMDAILCDESRWTKDRAARKANHRGTYYWDDLACSFCMAGARDRALATDDAHLILREVCGEVITAWNDDPATTFSMVKAKLREMIEIAQKRGI